VPAILRAPSDMDFARPNYKFDIARVSDSNDMGKSLSRTGIMDRRKEECEHLVHITGPSRFFFPTPAS